MSRKGFRYTYELQSSSPAELGKVGDAYQNAGWIEVDFIPEKGIPTHVIFEWTLDRLPVYPEVDWP